MSALKNLASLRRNITRKIRQALQELQENLGNLERCPQRAPVPVRVPNHFRCISDPARFKKCQPRLYQASGCFFKVWMCQYLSCGQVRSVHTQASPNATRFNTQVFKWPRANQNVISHFYSNANFKTNSAKRFYNTPSLTQFLKKKIECEDERMPQQTYRLPALSVVASDVTVPLSLRFNKSLTANFHIEVMDLARPQEESSAPSGEGAYVDFHIQPSVNIPPATILTGDVLRELLANLKEFERRLVALQSDLTRLSSLGELPVKYIASENVIRVYFPNCDREKVQILLSEKNVVTGVVYEDVAGQCQYIERDESVGSISDFDILSSCNLSSSVSSGSNELDEDILSEPYCGAGNLVHLEPVASSGPVEIVDDFLWA